MLPQEHQLFPQFVLDLHAVQVHRDAQVFQYVLAEQHSMMPLHVEQFDGEHIHGAFQFEAGHAQWRRFFLSIPPLGGRAQGPQGFERRVPQHAEQIQVRQAGMKIAGHGRAEENDALEVGAARVLHSLHKLVNDLLRNHSVLAHTTNCCWPRPHRNCRRQSHRSRRPHQNRLRRRSHLRPNRRVGRRQTYWRKTSRTEESEAA